MNLLRPFIVLCLISSIVFSAFAGKLVLTKGDFSSASRKSQGSESLVLANLSSSGLAKMKSLNEKVGGTVEVNVAGEVHSFKLREPIRGENLQMGPFSNERAEKITNEVNAQK